MKTFLGIHKHWWPVFIFAGVMLALDVPIAMMFLQMAAHPEGVVGREPTGGWAGFAIFLMLEPTVALAPLTYFTAWQIQEEKKREEQEKKRKVTEAIREKIEASIVDVVPEDSDRAAVWKRTAGERERRRINEREQSRKGLNS